MDDVLADGECPIGDEHGIANVDGGGQGEDEIKHHAHTAQRGQILEVVAEVGLSPDFVDHGHGHDEHTPY